MEVVLHVIHGVSEADDGVSGKHVGPHGDDWVEEAACVTCDGVQSEPTCVCVRAYVFGGDAGTAYEAGCSSS